MAGGSRLYNKIAAYYLSFLLLSPPFYICLTSLRFCKHQILKTCKHMKVNVKKYWRTMCLSDVAISSLLQGII